MDAYPPDYLAHNLPLILVSGLANPVDDESSVNIDDPLLQTNGTEVDSDFPLLDGRLADDLQTAFLEQDASNAPWSASPHTGRPNGTGLRIKSIGRSYRLPPRKANVPSSIPTSPSFAFPATHSPISPLTPGSPTFPDGMLTPLWVTKHQRLVPATVINVFPVTSDPSMSTLRDNQLKIEIRGLKETWASSGYKTRFVVILVAEDNLNLQDLDDRLASIRRSTNLDPRSLFLLYPDLSAVEVKDFVRSLLSSLQPSVVEYYRDLSKHARRKRNRASIPPPTAPPTSGTSQTLSVQGWNVRYEFKLGIFAEFRQEMEAAQRNFESAYETLFGQEVFESIAGWNPRFNDARLLADVLAIRIIRCLLWSAQSTAAVRFWVGHRARTQDIVHRKGKGTKNYGWEAWDARWSTVMAQLVSRAELPAFSPDILNDPERVHESIFHPPEKTLANGENLLPWELLHHEGYWLDRSATHLVQRRALAEQIPQEDRVAPNQSPPSQTGGKSQFYDQYLVPEPYLEASGPETPGTDHTTLIIDTLNASLVHFAARRQIRKFESLSLQIAKEHIKAKQWTQAHKLLVPLWPRLTWRVNGWWALMEEFAWTLRECAIKEGDSDTLVRIHWELLNQVFSRRPTWDYNFHNCLQDITVGSPRPSIVLKAEDVVTCVSASLVFEKGEGNVGEPLQIQLAITSTAHPHSVPISLSEVKIVFEGSLRPIKIQPVETTEGETDPPSCQISTVSLRDSAISTDSSTILSPTGGIAPMIGTAELTFKPLQTRVFNLTSIPRESGDAQIASVTLAVEEEKFNLVYAITDHKQLSSFWWVNTTNGPRKRRIGKDRDPTLCRILPKPPRIHIDTLNLRETYYTNERVVLKLAIENHEDEAAEATLQVRLFGQPESSLRLAWADASEDQTEIADAVIDNTPHSISRSIGTVAPSSIIEMPVVLSETLDALDYELEVSVRYSLLSDIQTPISKTVMVELGFVRPFEANYDFLPRIHPEGWPDFFHLDDAVAENDTNSKPNGLQQKWSATSKIVSFASEPLVVEKVTLSLVGTHGGVLCDIGQESLITPEAPQILPEELRESEFDLSVQKASLDDRRSATLDLALEVQWRRPAADDSEPSTVSSLAVPRFLIPMGEPRILASASSSRALSGLIHLDYTLENPSMHSLTFNIAMEASEHFAFSGPKTKALQLAPLSRHTVRYNLLTFRPGTWIQPHLVVIDTYFNKTLRILPTEGMRTDKKGLLVWVDAEG